MDDFIDDYLRVMVRRVGNHETLSQLITGRYTMAAADEAQSRDRPERDDLVIIGEDGGCCAYYRRTEDLSGRVRKASREKVLRLAEKKGVRLFEMRKLGDRNYRLVRVPTHKDTLYERQKGICNGCLVHFPVRNFTVDHIVPRSKGGSDHLDNLQLLCGACNSKKGERSMAELIAELKAAGIRNGDVYRSSTCACT